MTARCSTSRNFEQKYFDRGEKSRKVQPAESFRCRISRAIEVEAEANDGTAIANHVPRHNRIINETVIC